MRDMIRLLDIAEVKHGTSIDRISKSGDRRVKLFTLQSFDKNGFYTGTYKEIFISKEENIEISKVGDIIVKQTFPCTVSVINEETKGYAIGSQFVLIKKSNYNSDLIAYLVTKEVQKELKIALKTIIFRLNIKSIRDTIIDDSAENITKSSLYYKIKKLEVINEKTSILEQQRLKFYLNNIGIRKDSND